MSLLLITFVQAGPLVQNGVADLRDWNVQANPTVALDGDWLLHWGSSDAAAAPFRVPGVWNGREANGRKLPAFGHAWFEVTLLLPEAHPPLALYYPYLKSAARIFVNGRLLAELGAPGGSAEREEAYMAPGLVVLPADTGRMHLVMEVSNHFHYEGGINGNVVIGAESLLGAREATRRAISVAVLGATLALGLYLFLLTRGRSRVAGDRFFIALLIFSFLRVLGIDDWLARAGLPMILAFRLEYLSLFVFPPLYAWLLRSLFPEEVPRRFCCWLSLIEGAGIFASLFFPAAWFTRLRDPGSLMLVVSVLFLFVCSLRALKHRRPDALIVTLGAVCLAVGIFHDVLRYAHLIESDLDLASAGLLPFLFAHGVALGNRLFAAWDENIQLTDRLAELNSGLEAEVESRTASLARQAAELEHRRQLAEDEARDKSRFLATLSHELRTPLTGIQGNMDLLQQELPAGVSSTRTEQVRRATRALVQLLDGVLAMARAEAGRAERGAEVFAPRDLLAEVSTLLEPLAMRKGLSLTCSVGRDVPAWLAGGATSLRRVLINLISNAIRFSDMGEVTVRMTVSKPHSTYQIDVTDTGPGMTAALQERLFEEFYRDARTAEPGSGLGLFIVDRLVKAMHGTISVDSEPGRGTRMSVFLPLQVSQKLPEPAGAKHQSCNILLVEDVAINREVMRELLTRDGHRVDSVGDGGQAVTAVRETSYDVVLMDLRLCEMHGREAARLIRELPDVRRAQTPIVALTAEATTLDDDFCNECGMDAVVNKPIRLEELYPVLQDIFEQRSARQLPRPRGAAGGTVDKSRLADLVDAVGSARVRALLLELATTLIGQRRALQTAQAENDQAAIHAAAHRIVGAAENFGFVEVGRYATRVRNAPETRRSTAVTELIDLIHKTVPLVYSEAEEL